VIWLFDRLVWKQRATRGKGHESTLVVWAYDFWPVLALVLVVRSFLIEPFNIPSESMVPTLQTGDFILVNKFAYGVRLPIVNQKILTVGEPKRGEVVVFRYPLNPSTNYIKRVVGLPNDIIAYKEGALTINGQAITRQNIPDLGDSSYERFYHEGLGTHNHLIRELNDVYSGSQAPFVNTYDRGRFMGRAGHEWEVKVPAGHYFVMGDNRDQSADSRWWGFVPEGNLSGRAFYVWMHKPQGLHLPTFSRNGMIN
jgi:signal peptidase I